MIDLHLHTTASDGRLTPTALVTRATASGVRILAVTDHDTTDGFDEAAIEAARLDVLVIPGIEITAVERGRDVHMLAYFFDRHDAAFGPFLAAQRATRVTRIAEMATRLDALGMPVDAHPLLDQARRDTGSRSAGRRSPAPTIAARPRRDHARGLRHVAGSGSPSLRRTCGGATRGCHRNRPCRRRDCFARASSARTKLDERIPALRDAGLDAIEAYHSDHDLEMATSI